MQCPFCQHQDSSVLESRESEDGQVTRRRRECGECGKRFTSYERVEGPQLLVVKKNGRREQFDRAKIRRGIARAVEKRSISSDLVDELVDQVEREMLKKSTSEVSSRVIGNALLKRLKKIDKVAYVRFASVYLDFNEIDDFVQLVKDIK